MIDRATMVEQSVQDYAREALAARGYVEGSAFDLVDEFPYVLEEEMTRPMLAIGFDFDDGGEPAETGSSLTRLTYTIEFFTFALTRTFSRNLAAVLKFALDSEGTIPLKDFTQDAEPIVDRMEVINVTMERQTVVDPDPWQENVYSVALRVEDTYLASLV